MSATLLEPYVTVDFGTAGNAQGKINDAKSFSISVWCTDGTVTTISFNVTPGSTTIEGAAFLAATALNNASIQASSSGGVLSITSTPDKEIERVVVSVTNSIYVHGGPIKLPKVQAYNGATGTSVDNVATGS